MSLELILGPMFAGKSSRILSIVNRYKAIDKSVLILSHLADSRYSETHSIVNHDGSSIPCYKTSELMVWYTSDYFEQSQQFQNAHLIIIEEGQFFKDLYEFVQQAVDIAKKHVIVVGLDGDADRKPFGQILDLIPICDKVTKLTAFCSECKDGTKAIFTFCKKEKDTQVCVGGSELYSPYCRKHYVERSGSS